MIYYLTKKELAEELGVSPQTIYNWVKKNKIPYKIKFNQIAFTNEQADAIKLMKDKILHSKPEGYKSPGWYDKHRKKKNDEKTS